MYTTLVGRPIADLDTPALLVDLDVMERNIAGMSRQILGHGIGWRPHSKAHKSPAVAHKQLAAGALGVTCAKLGEAEVMAAAGVRDILIANQIVGPIKTRRLAALCAHADVIVAVDSRDNVRELDAAAGAAGTRPRVVVEVNSGMDRCGVAPGEETLALSHEIASCPHLRYAGLMAWEGHAMAVDDPARREQTVRAAIALLTETADACRAAGLPVEIVSCGGSGTYIVTAGIPGVTEVQAGGGTFGDLAYRELGAPVEPALTLLAQVVSRPCADRIVFDAGRKAVDPTYRPPMPRGLDGVLRSSLSAEHMTLALDGGSQSVRIGDRFEFEIGYSDQTVHLHEQLYGIRDGVIETVWPIAGRGRLQ